MSQDRGPGGAAKARRTPDLRTLIRMGREMVDIYCASHDAPPAAVTLDIDDTFDAAHGLQQLTFWNGFYRERGYAPIHVYETGSGRPVAFVLRPARTPSGTEIRGHVRRLIRRIRTHWPDTGITLCGEELEDPAPCHRPDRGNDIGHGYPHHRDLAEGLHGRAAL